VTPPINSVSWHPCWRIIPSRFPPIDLFERVAAPEDLEAIIALEGLTNPRLRDEVGTLSLVPPADRVTGPGASIIMAAFTHPNPSGSRFSNGSYGVFYAAGDLETAIAETRYHRAAFLQATRQARIEIDMRAYLADLTGDLHDIRQRQAGYETVYDPQDYSAGQQLAAKLRREGSNGIAYNSVRRSGGQCAAIFRPPLLSNARQERHLCYVWDGQSIATIYEKREV
jgi:hypothetical protein